VIVSGRIRANAEQTSSAVPIGVRMLSGGKRLDHSGKARHSSSLPAYGE